MVTRRAPHQTVKAREHHGASSLDLTLPADVRKSCDVHPGDVFTVHAECGAQGEVTIRYERVYRAPRGGVGGGCA